MRKFRKKFSSNINIRIDSPKLSNKIEQFWQVPYNKSLKNKYKAFIDFQYDVTSNEIFLASSEGYQSIEHLKRYSTLGMGTDQGKTSNVTVIGLLSENL